MKVVISLGGSIAFKEKIDSTYLKKFAALIKKMPGTYGIVVGGGRKAREYVEVGKKFKEDNFSLDMLGIQVTKANARLVKATIPKSRFFDEIEKAVTYLSSGKSKIAIMGGSGAGHTTDTVSALLAEDLGAARMINLSDVDAIYDKDPKKFRNAKKMKRMSHSNLVSMAARYDKRGPRANFVMDLVAAKILARSKIETHFVNGRKLEDVRKAIKGKKHSGTVIY